MEDSCDESNLVRSATILLVVGWFVLFAGFVLKSINPIDCLVQESRENAVLVRTVANGLEIDTSGKLIFAANVPAMWRS